MYKFESLLISKPVKIVGEAGTVLEVYGGSINIKFKKTYDSPTKLSRINKHNITKSKVAIITDCEVLFNRSRAWFNR